MSKIDEYNRLKSSYEDCKSHVRSTKEKYDNAMYLEVKARKNLAEYCQSMDLMTLIELDETIEALKKIRKSGRTLLEAKKIHHQLKEIYGKHFADSRPKIYSDYERSLEYSPGQHERDTCLPRKDRGSHDAAEEHRSISGSSETSKHEGSTVPNLHDAEERVTESSGGMKDDGNKPRWDLLPMQPIEDIVKIMTFGAKKYAPNNWQKVDKDRYIAAFYRHVVAWQNGEKIDTDSGQHHLAHALCNLVFLLWKEEYSDGKN